MLSGHHRAEMAATAVPVDALDPGGLPPGVSVWSIDLGSMPDATALACLSADELARAQRFAFDHHRRRYLASHVALRRVLARHLDRAAGEIVLVHSAHGKPSLAGRPGCEFNLSHSDDVALVALSEHGAVGVDVEVLRALPDADELAAMNYTAGERDWMARGAPDLHARRFLACWTRKEACLKAIGSGLSVAPQTFDAGPADRPGAVAIDWAGQRFELRALPLAGAPGTVAALAVRLRA